MSQAGDQLVEQINALTARVQQIVQDGANAATEKADHAADLANVGQAVQGLAAALPTPPAPPEG
jgi:hypothetical protein